MLLVSTGYRNAGKRSLILDAENSVCHGTSVLDRGNGLIGLVAVCDFVGFTTVDVPHSIAAMSAVWGGTVRHNFLIGKSC